MATGLSVSDVVNVSVSMSPLAAAARALSNLLILGSTSGVIDTTERMREYASMDDVAVDFGSTTPEYLAALQYFAQVPQPTSIFIGKFAQAATHGRVLGAPLNATEQALANFTAVSAGSLKLNVNGTVTEYDSIDLSAATSLNNAASLITTAIGGAATVAWNAGHNRFEVTSSTTGLTSAIGFAVTPATGTNLGPLMLLQSADGGRTAIGSAVETPAEGVVAAAAYSNNWYAVMDAPVTALSDNEVLAIAAYVEAASPSRIYGTTTQSALVPDSAQTSDIASALSAAGYNRTLIQYSSSSPYAVASLLGRALTVDFTGNNTAITLKYKNEPGVTAETLTESQAAALTAKHCNVFVNYNNSTAIIQQGCMCGGNFIDETQGLDWMQDAIQTNVYNLLYTSPTKIPQTDAGVNQIVASCEAAMAQSVANGLVAPGIWDAGGFGALVQGQTLAKGYYIYAAPVSSQSSGDRAARKAPAIQIAAKLAGAVHSANVIVNVNR